MYVSFNELPDTARLWIYQADREFTDIEKAALETRLLHLCQSWAAHGTPLKSSFQLAYNHFILLAVDERDAGASGCSIDGTVRLLKDIQQQLGLDFFNRQLIAFLDQNSVILYPTHQLKTLFAAATLTGDSVTFNNAITTKGEWVKQWKEAVKDSWLARYLPKAAGVGSQP